MDACGRVDGHDEWAVDDVLIEHEMRGRIVQRVVPLREDLRHNVMQRSSRIRV